MQKAKSRQQAAIATAISLLYILTSKARRGRKVIFARAVTMKLLSTVLLASTLSSSSAYFSSNTRRATSTSTFVRVNNDEKKSKLSTLMRMSKDDERDAGIGSGLLSKFNPLKEIGDMFQNLDDGKNLAV